MDRLKTGLILLLLAALAGSVAWAATAGEAEVRISARQLDDGRVEFALQQRVDGEWGERILPAQRYFPASVDHNRWLNSPSIAVSVASDEAEDGALEASPPAATVGAVRTTVGDGITDSGALWSVWRDDFTDELRAAVWASSTSSSRLYDGSFILRCSGGDVLEGYFVDLPYAGYDDPYYVTVRWGSNTPWSGQWDGSGDEAAFVPNADLYRQNVNRYDTLRVRFTGYSTTITVTYDVAAMRDAPAWPNIVACGTSNH